MPKDPAIVAAEQQALAQQNTEAAQVLSSQEDEDDVRDALIGIIGKARDTENARPLSTEEDTMLTTLHGELGDLQASSEKFKTMQQVSGLVTSLIKLQKLKEASLYIGDAIPTNPTELTAASLEQSIGKLQLLESAEGDRAKPLLDSTLEESRLVAREALKNAEQVKVIREEMEKILEKARPLLDSGSVQEYNRLSALKQEANLIRVRATNDFGAKLQSEDSRLKGQDDLIGNYGETTTQYETKLNEYMQNWP